MKRIFISSPFEHLTETRQALARLVESRPDWRVAWAEDDFDRDARTDARLWSVYEAARSDAGFIILNGRYGSRAPGQSKSFTYLEIDALNAVSGRTVVLRLPDTLERDTVEQDDARRFQQMLAAAVRRGSADEAQVIEVDHGSRAVEQNWSLIERALSAALDKPEPESAAAARMLYPTAALQSRLWRIVNANHRSFRGAYKTLIQAREAVEKGEVPKSESGLAPAQEFVSSTLQRFAAFEAARRQYDGDNNTIDAVLAGDVVWGADHPLARLYATTGMPCRDWTEDLSRLVSDRDAHRLTFAENEGAGPVAYLRLVWGRYPAIGRDLIGIEDTDLKDALCSQAFTWNRYKLLSNRLVELMQELDPECCLVPERDRRYLRFRTSWDSRSLADEV